jgi:hypothetical protein
MIGSPQHTGRPRGASLTERFPGDESHRPLDIIRRESKKAHRSPHLRKDRHHGVDSIDQLAGIEGAYHHQGPYDVASQARNRYEKDSPIAALATSNAEALKATPRENIIDAVRHHRPLDGIAQVPPGVPDRNGEVYEYEEGTDMQRGTGDDALRQWSGYVVSSSFLVYVQTNNYQTYHPDDRKGKGEPSYSIEKALKDHKRAGSGGDIELVTRSRPISGENFKTRSRASSGANAATGTDQSYAEWETSLRRSSSGKASKLVRKLGSLRRRHHPSTDERDI